MNDPIDPSLARVTVTRAAADDTGTRQIIITLDDAPFATLLHDRSVTREIPPGHHRLRANNTLIWKTIEFDVAAGDQVQFNVANTRGAGTMALLGLLGVGPMYLRFERVSG